MARYITSTDQNVSLNSTIPFDIVTVPCNKGLVVPLVPGVVILRGCGTGRFIRYDVTVQGNVSIPTGGAVTPIAVAITINGAVAPDSIAIVTPTAAEDVWHINTSTTITVPSGCCVSVSAVYADATEDNAAVTPTPSIFVRRRASLTVKRIA